MKQYIIPLIFLFLGSCAHQQSQISPGLSFEFINSIPLGTHSAVIKQSLGEPTTVSNEGDNTVAWYYALGSYNKLALLFDSTSMKVLSKFWNVEDGEKEFYLKHMLAQYPQAHFESKDSKFIHPHQGKSTEIWHQDLALGIYLEVGKKYEHVQSIYWCAPNIPPTKKNCLKSWKDPEY